MQIIDDVKNADDDDEYLNCTITFLCGYVNFSKDFFSITMNNR